MNIFWRLQAKDFTKSNTPPWVFFTFFKLHKWYQIAQRITNNQFIPAWLSARTTVLVPKAKDFSNEKNYRPITCLNTSCKIMTGLVNKYIRHHAIENNIWDKGQLGVVEGVLGTVD